MRGEAKRVRDLVLVCVVALLAGCATPNAGRASRTTDDAILAMRAEMVYKSEPTDVQVSGELGSRTNPVRVLMPEGEQEYLYRLRCGDGAQPKFERAGSAGFGPYRKIVDIYALECPNGGVKATVVMDMYHCVEDTQPPPGFTIVPEIGARDKPECR